MLRMMERVAIIFTVFTVEIQGHCQEILKPKRFNFCKEMHDYFGLQKSRIVKKLAKLAGGSIHAVQLNSL